MDFTDKESVRKFIKENDIRDIAQLNSMLFQFLVFSSRNSWKLNEMNT